MCTCQTPDCIYLNLCHCGCGQIAPLYRDSSTKEGIKAGQARKFINGHQNRNRVRTASQRVANSKAKSGFNHPNFGKKLSKKTRTKIGKNQKGSKNPNWRGGVSAKNKRIRASVKFKIWREKVFVRDNFTCKSCGQRGGELHPHHIKSFAGFPKLRFIVSNGLTLCKPCHQKTPTFGRYVDGL